MKLEIEVEPLVFRFEAAEHAVFDINIRTGRIWLPILRRPTYLKAYIFFIDNSLACRDVERKLTQYGVGYAGNLTGEDGDQKSLRFFLY